MLVEMRFSNIYSIKDEISIDFRAANINNRAVKNLSDNVINFNDRKFLKVQGIYGPNASGKSNILKAAFFAKQLILESYQYNEGAIFNYIPFKFDGYSDRPSSFFIHFFIDDVEYEYSFTLNRHQIISEELYYYKGRRKSKIFTRNEELSSEKSKIYSFSKGYFNLPMDIAISTSKKSLFISKASQMDRELAKKIYNFFRTQLIIGLPILTGLDVINLFKRYKSLIIEALQMVDSDIVDIDYRIDKIPLLPMISPIQTQKNSISMPLDRVPITEIVNFYTTHKYDKNITFNLMAEESNGTKHIFNLLLILFDVCKNGKTLILDEFDSSLHADLSQFILDIFYSSKSSQLLFTTHNTNLLDVKKIRKDQIIFTNKKTDCSTEVYSLFEFKDFRENMDAEKCYLDGRFDAIPYIDYSKAKLKKIFS